MNALAFPRILESVSARLAATVEPAALLAARAYAGWVFLKSGALKLADWGSTLALFEYEYQVPLLPPAVAAVVGTAGELLFGALVIAGLYGRVSALGLFAVNALAVISYRQVLLAEGYEAALAQHVLWGTLLVALFLTGPGRWSADRLLQGSTAPAAAHPAVS
jgi:putative oxidoreductase